MKFTDRIRDYGLTLDEDVIICDRSVVDKSADIIDELEAALRIAGMSAGFQYMTYETRDMIDDALAKLEKLNRE